MGRKGTPKPLQKVVVCVEVRNSVNGSELKSGIAASRCRLQVVGTSVFWCDMNSIYRET